MKSELPPTITPRNAIAANWYQIALGQYGGVKIDNSDVAQCIKVILTTPQGTDPFRPTFACNVGNYLDWSVKEAKPYIVREVLTAIAQWEPRAKVTSVEVLGYGDRDDIEPQQLLCRVQWSLVALPGFSEITEVIFSTQSVSLFLPKRNYHQLF